MYRAALEKPNSVMTLSKSIECTIDPVVLLKTLSDDINLNNKVLLESCEINNKQKLKSILMNRAALRIECHKQQVTITSLTSNGENALLYLSKLFDLKITQTSDKQSYIVVEYQSPFEELTNQEIDEETRLKQITPIDCLRKINHSFNSQNNHPFAVYLCGVFSFDFIASFEDLPEVPNGNNDCPDYVFYLAEELIVFDHQTRQANIYSNIFSGENSENNYYEQSRRIEDISSRMSDIERSESRLKQISKINGFEPTCDISDEAYIKIVNSLKKQIVAGNIFQVVPSRTFTMPCLDTLLSYQYLKDTNPSPYMFYMQDENFSLFGASPESALKYTNSNNNVELYPIAGTRPRGKYANGNIDHDLDKRLEAELKQDQKEIAEHMMLVDLARNDIARISNPGSQEIPRLLEIDRYSQVMHLVSCVQGKLKNALDCFHAYQACMNMGTLTGAPKIKATELIRKVEKKRRGSYGGAVGYINTLGDMDTCIVIRSAFCKNGKAHIQAGAGIVFDSQPKLEAEETKAKANAVIFAIQQANNHLTEGSCDANK